MLTELVYKQLTFNLFLSFLLFKVAKLNDSSADY